MKLSNSTKSILAYCVGMLLTYVLGAFVAWDLNAGNWSFDGRMMTAMVGVVIGMCLVGMTAEL